MIVRMQGIDRWDQEHLMDATWERCNDHLRPELSEAWTALHAADAVGKAWMEDRKVSNPKVDTDKIKQFCIEAPGYKPWIDGPYKVLQEGVVVDFQIKLNNHRYSIGREAAGLLKIFNQIAPDEEAIPLPMFPIDPSTKLREANSRPTYRWFQGVQHRHRCYTDHIDPPQPMLPRAPDGPVAPKITTFEAVQMSTFLALGAIATGFATYGVYRLPMPKSIPVLSPLVQRFGKLSQRAKIGIVAGAFLAMPTLVAIAVAVDEAQRRRRYY